MTLYVAGTDVLWVWIADNGCIPASNALRRAIPRVILAIIGAIHLDKHCVVYIAPKRSLDCI
jgi:hypothetical protein